VAPATNSQVLRNGLNLNRRPTGSVVRLTGVILLLAISAESASSATNRIHFSEKSIDGVSAYAWDSKGSSLVYATSDGTLWSVSGPDFAPPIRAIKIALPDQQQIEQIVWSPDGRNIAVVSPRSNDLWDTIWLVDIKAPRFRDLLPPGAPFGGPGARALRISSWLPDGRIAFVLHCGTGCAGLHAVQTQGDEGYWDFCDASGSFFWSPTGKDAVVQNDAEGIGPVGLGLVSASDGVPAAKGASFYRPRKECSSVFKGAVRCATCGPSQVKPDFNSWFPDSRTVLYTDEGLNSSELKLWNTVSGLRTPLVARGSSGALSPDGHYVAFFRPVHESATTSDGKRASLAILDLRSKQILAFIATPNVQGPVQWSPSARYLAILARDGKLLLATLSPDGMQVRKTEVSGEEISWSPDGKYLAVRDHFYDPATIRILKFPPDSAPSTATVPDARAE
jgi:WD40 repeat protein